MDWRRGRIIIFQKRKGADGKELTKEKEKAIEDALRHFQMILLH